MDIDKISKLLTGVAALAIPFVIAVLGNEVSQTLKEKEIQAKYVELSISVLQLKPAEDQPDLKNLRTWAVNVIDKYSGVPMSADTRTDLIEKVPLPSRSITGISYNKPTGKSSPTENTAATQLSVPKDVDHVYVIFQFHGPLVNGSSELFTIADRSEFIRDFELYRATARERNVRLILTAANAGETQWLHSGISFKGKPLKVTMYRDPGSLPQNFPGVEVPLD